MELQDVTNYPPSVAGLFTTPTNLTDLWNITGRLLNDDSDFIHLKPLNCQPKLKVFH